MIPELERHCGSWIVSRRDTGEVAFETFERSVVERLDPAKAIIETAAQYLGRLHMQHCDHCRATHN